MKKLLTVFLSSVLLLGLIACGLSSPSEAPHIPDGSDPSATSALSEAPDVSEALSADTSSEASTVSDDEPIPDVSIAAPGTLTDVDELPIADASEVGKKVTVNLALNGKTEEISFVFRRNAETGKERLVTIENSNDSKNVMLLSVYETSLGSGEALCEALETGTCDAVLAARVYIDWIEGKYTTHSFHGLMNDTGADGFVQNPFEANGQCFFGLICHSENTAAAESLSLVSNGERSVYLYAADGSDKQPPSIATVWQRIYERFDEKYGLLALISVD